jgi:hypothetical protein
MRPELRMYERFLQSLREIRAQMLTHLSYVLSRVSNPVYSFIYALTELQWLEETAAHGNQLER